MISMIQTGSSFIVLYTDDLQKTASFYEKFGITIKEQDAHRCVFRLGDLEMHFNTSEDIKEYKYIYHTKGCANIFYIEVDDLDYYFTIVKCIGGAIKSEITERPWGTKEFLFQDPNGYNIVFYEEM